MISYQTPLLADSEPLPFTVINEGGTSPCLILSDHSGVAVPEKLDMLGLEAEDFNHHAAQDVGVCHVTETLANLLDATAIMGNYSRLVIDLNRRLEHPTAFAKTMEGRPVPGNEHISDDDRRARIDEIYNPYHHEVERLLEGYRKRGVIPVIISLHSFTPVFFKQVRPWEIGILWVQDPRVPLALIRYFAQRGYCVGNNEPYDARALRGSTIDRHADSQGFPNALIEFRNNEIDTPEKGELWAQMMAEAMAGILEDENIHSLYDGPRVSFDPYLEKTYFEELVQRAQQGE